MEFSTFKDEYRKFIKEYLDDKTSNKQSQKENMSNKLKPLTFEEHENLAKDLRLAQEILEPWLEKLWKAYGVKHINGKNMWNILNLLSSKICNTLSTEWYKIPTKDLEAGDPNLGHNCPYYGDGKSAYFQNYPIKQKSLQNGRFLHR